MTRVLCLIFLLIGFSACGSSQENAEPTIENPNVSPTEITISDGAVGAQITPTTDESSAPSHVDCGDIAMSSNRALDDADAVRAATACFGKAYASCTAATLTIHERDTNYVRQFTIEPGTKCDIREALQPDPNSPPAIVDCESVRVENDKLTISKCSHFDDFILEPAK